MRQSSGDYVGTVNKQFTVNKQLKTQDSGRQTAALGIASTVARRIKYNKINR
jgi:hypothetical protein